MQTLILNDFQTAQNAKRQNPNITLIVSLEKDNSMDSYWLNHNNLNSLPPSFVIVRIIQQINPEAASHFQQDFSVDTIPSIFIFGPGSDSIQKSWEGSFPPISELLSYCLSISAPTETFRFTKITVMNGSDIKQRDFLYADKIIDLKNWLREVTHIHDGFIVSHTMSLLSNDDSLTLEQAGLCPSALIRVQTNANTGPSAPRRGTANQPANTHNHGFCFWFKFVFSFLNPFASVDEAETFWEFQPQFDLELGANPLGLRAA